ncbi:hypothetical protein [Moraxella ovis]|uniref:hypothetical protein n=1 Tax=Moraxella ovis TaxID=29433 RepID=UPI000E0415BD|nr:Uncharacterised protein [Moraxella ovis]
MLDHLRLAVPVFPIHAVERGQGNFYFEGDLLKLGLNCGARVVTLGDDGKPKAQDYMHLMIVLVLILVIWLLNFR